MNGANIIDMTHHSVIREIKFYVLGNDDNIKDSSVEVSNKDLFRNLIPIRGGPYDPHMGTTDNHWNCQTCHQSKPHCPGHYGHMLLNYPVQSPMFRDEILQWLKIICFNCGELLVNKSIKNVARSRKLSEYVSITRNSDKSRNIACVNCKEVHPHITKDIKRPVTIWAEFYSGNTLKNKYQLFNHLIEKIFDRISEVVLEKIGKTMASHPSKFIIKIMKISPNTIRPDIKRMGGGRTNNDDITTLTKSMVEINRGLPPIIPEIVTEELEIDYTNLDMLYYEMIKGTPITSKKNKITTNSNKPPSSIASRLVGKPGRTRKNLMGCRTWYTVRSVITGDPMIPIDCVGIPIYVAKTIQIPEHVNKFNRNRMMIYFSNKTDIYPGCTKIIKKSTGKEHWVGALKSDFVIEDGDIILRDVIDGDPVIFNRQPSLLISNVGCHKTIVLKKGDTVRINISACSSYAADFDGDAVNLHFAQSVLSRNEILMKANIGNHFISKKNSIAMMGCFQDNLAGVVEMTHDIKINRNSAMDLFKNIHDVMELDKDYYTGRELLSMLLPPINYNAVGLHYKTKFAHIIKYRESDVNVVIKRGEIKQGILDHKSTGQERQDTIFHVIHNKYGPKIAMETLFNFQQLSMEYIYNKGFTAAIDDIFVPPETIKVLHEKTSALLMESKRITKKLINGEIIPPIGMTIRDFYEIQQIETLNTGDDFIIPILESIDTKNNGFFKMISMCKKGNMGNFQSIAGARGQVLINGTRIKKNFGFERTLPYFPRYDTDPLANGFIPESYLSGFSSISYFVECQEARYGVINKALSTSVVGDISRQSIKNIESAITNNFRQCVKNDKIIQMIYGGNGFEVKAMVDVDIPTIFLSDADLREHYFMNPKKINKKFINRELKKALEEEFKLIIKERDDYRRKSIIFEATQLQKNISNTIKSPINVERIINDILWNNIVEFDPKDFNPNEVVIKLNKFYGNISYIYMNSIQEKLKTSIAPLYKIALKQTITLIRCYLNIRKIFDKKITLPLLGLIMDDILINLKKSLVSYGLAVGVVSAQCLTEPITQVIISSHHKSGVAGDDINQTDMLTRNKELFSAKTTEKMKMPQMLLFVKQEYEHDLIRVSKIANHIETMKFRNFVKNVGIFFESYGEIVHPDYQSDIKLLRDYENYNSNVKRPNDLVKWAIRFELDKMKLILKNMTLETIIFKIVELFPDLYVVYNYENAKRVIVRCYMRQGCFKKKSNINLEDLKTFRNILLNTVIRGCKGILSTKIVKVNKSTIDEQGKLINKPVWAIRTRGTNLSKILENPYLDRSRCSSSSVKEIEKIFGISAARNKLIIELRNIIQDLDPSHYELFTDEMSFTGRITGIAKSGLDKREKNNVLLRTSYQHQIKVLREAALNSQTSKIYGISAPLMLGAIPRVGTTYNSIGIDQQFIEENVKSVESILDEL